MRNAKLKQETKAPSATDKHKEWLKNFAKVKKTAIDEAEKFKKMKEEEKSKFMERTSLLRTLLRQNQWKNNHHYVPKLPSEDKKEIEKLLTAPKKRLEKVLKADKTKNEPEPDKSESKSATAVPEIPKLKNRPKWSLTKSQIEEGEQVEEDELLNFAMNLDFEKFMDDMEVRDAITFVQGRVKELEMETSEIESEEKKREDAVKEAVRAERVAEIAVERAESEAKTASTTEGTSSISKQTTSNGDDIQSDSADNHSKTALSQKKIKQIHSKNSIASVINRQREKRKSTSGMVLEQRYSQEGHTEPKREIDTIDFKSSVKSRKPPQTKPSKSDTSKVQNLPYMYCHPSI